MAACHQMRNVMALEHDLVGAEIVDWLTRQYTSLERDTINPARIHLSPLPENEQACSSASYDLTPIDLPMEVADARTHFQQITSLEDLISEYWAVRQNNSFEHDIPAAMDNIHPWADEFLETLMVSASNRFSDEDACLIAQFVSTLDIYAAVKTIESLLNDPQDMLLLQIAKEENWQVHLDHITIRCGNQQYEDAERIFNFLMKHHHYYPPQHIEEAYLVSDNGWNAYPLYKIMENGQFIRIFIDQADSEHQQQAIQHWNHAYGYTAHHIGLRLTTQSENGRKSLTLPEILNQLQKYKITTSDSLLTHPNLMQQALIRPHKNNQLPKDILQGAARINTDLPSILEQGKFIALVSRIELPDTLKEKWFKLYQIGYDFTNPLHSAPAFNLFSPLDSSTHCGVKVSSSY